MSLVQAYTYTHIHSLTHTHGGKGIQDKGEGKEQEAAVADEFVYSMPNRSKLDLPAKSTRQHTLTSAHTLKDHLSGRLACSGPLHALLNTPAGASI
jgi:hypothetical protein